jgi:hypothetical protein
MVTVALKTQHGVNEVFQHPWPGKVTFFCDVPDENEWD